MGNSSIKISISMPQSEDIRAHKPPKPDIEQRIQHAVDCFLCNENAEQAYAFIEKVNNFIQEKTPGTLTPRDKRILGVIKEVITLHGFKRGTIINSSHMMHAVEPEDE